MRVVRVSRQGKGNVVRAMLKRVEADVYVMLDADATYPAARIPDLTRPVLDGSSDMVVGARLGSPVAGAFRRFHHTGNVVLCWLISLIWGARLTDVLSGYRAFTLRYYNLTGFLGWLWRFRILGRTEQSRGLVRFFDRVILPAQLRLERALRLPAGQSVYAVAKKR